MISILGLNVQVIEHVTLFVAQYGLLPDCITIKLIVENGVFL